MLSLEERKKRQAERARAWRLKNRDRHLANVKRWHAANPERKSILARRTRERLWDLAFEAYGAKCSCCGEEQRAFLTLEHLNGDGSHHRRNCGGSSHAILRDLKKRGWPDGYAIRCFNCNLGRERNNGICPHHMTQPQTSGGQ